MIESEVLADFKILSEIIVQKDKQISELTQELSRYRGSKLGDFAEEIRELKAENERLKVIDNFKENYGYTNYEDEYMLEDLQSRAFQSEDDTEVVNKVLDYLNITDENDILPKLQQQLKEKDEEIENLKETNKVLSNELTKENIIKQDHLYTCYSIPISDIPELKAENERLKKELLFAKTFENKKQMEESLREAYEVIEFRNQQLAEKNAEFEKIKADKFDLSIAGKFNQKNRRLKSKARRRENKKKLEVDNG